MHICWIHIFQGSVAGYSFALAFGLIFRDILIKDINFRKEAAELQQLRQRIQSVISGD